MGMPLPSPIWVVPLLPPTPPPPFKKSLVRYSPRMIYSTISFMLMPFVDQHNLLAQLMPTLMPEYAWRVVKMNVTYQPAINPTNLKVNHQNA